MTLALVHVARHIMYMHELKFKLNCCCIHYYYYASNQIISQRYKGCLYTLFM